MSKLARLHNKEVRLTEQRFSIQELLTEAEMKNLREPWYWRDMKIIKSLDNLLWEIRTNGYDPRFETLQLRFEKGNPLAKEVLDRDTVIRWSVTGELTK